MNHIDRLPTDLSKYIFELRDQMRQHAARIIQAAWDRHSAQMNELLQLAYWGYYTYLGVEWHGASNFAPSRSDTADIIEFIEKKIKVTHKRTCSTLRWQNFFEDVYDGLALGLQGEADPMVAAGPIYYNRTKEAYYKIVIKLADDSDD
jgi:hypothetical protein